MCFEDLNMRTAQRVTVGFSAENICLGLPLVSLNDLKRFLKT